MERGLISFLRPKEPKQSEHQPVPSNVVPFKPAVEPQITRTIAWRIETTWGNIAQYARSIKAHALARMPFSQIAHAAKEIGDNVEFFQIDASVQQNQKNTVGDVVERPDQVWAWQDTGKQGVVISNQLPQASREQAVGQIVPISQYLEKTEQPVNTVEGISASVKTNPELPTDTSSYDQERENNQYLKKAA